MDVFIQISRLSRKVVCNFMMEETGYRTNDSEDYISSPDPELIELVDRIARTSDNEECISSPDPELIDLVDRIAGREG